MKFSSALVFSSTLSLLGFFQSTWAQPSPSNNLPQKWEPETVAPHPFSLLPKAFQKHPVLAISVITEMTEEGKKLPPPTQAQPHYFITHVRGFQQEGQGAYDHVKIASDKMVSLTTEVLAANHFRPADKEHPPQLVLFLSWGVHSTLWEGDPSAGEVGAVDRKYSNVLNRAALVGGTDFANELAKALKEQARTQAPGSIVIVDPVYMFTMRDDLTRNLMQQVLDDCYYVVVSAYDAAALARGERKLLWRTKMSTPSQGVSLPETAAALVASGKTLFGREMKKPSIIGKRINRGGTVELGELKVISMDDAPDAKPGKDAPAGKK